MDELVKIHKVFIKDIITPAVEGFYNGGYIKTDITKIIAGQLNNFLMLAYLFGIIETLRIIECENQKSSSSPNQVS